MECAVVLMENQISAETGAGFCHPCQDVNMFCCRNSSDSQMILFSLKLSDFLRKFGMAPLCPSPGKHWLYECERCVSVPPAWLGVMSGLHVQDVLVCFAEGTV